MKNQIILTLLSCLLLFSFSNTKKVFVNPDMKLHWKYELGKTTHRTEVAFFDNSLFIGSNGSHFMDWAIDSGNGVVQLNRKTGRKINSIADESFGDMDVNGILRYGQSIIFGNDNDEVLRYSKKGELVWRVPTSGDVEHAPILLKSGKKGDIVVFATETGEVRAVDPRDGSTHWKHYNESFKGWKMGDDRVVFKVKMHFTSGEIYFSKPAVVDLNKDGVKDLIYHCDDQYLALNGETGKIIWTIKEKKFEGYSPMGFRQTPHVSEVKGKLVLTLSYVNHKTDKFRVIQVDQNGVVVNRRELSYLAWGESLNHTKDIYYANGMVFDIGSLLPRKLPFYKNESGSVRFRFSGDAQLSREKLKLDQEEAVGVVFQHDREVRSQSMFMLIGCTTNKIYFKTHIPGGSEFTPVLRDVNQDGKVDLLIGSWDNTLYCYDLGIDSEQIIY